MSDNIFTIIYKTVLLPDPSSLNLTGNDSFCQETKEGTRLVTRQFRTSSKWPPARTVKIFESPFSHLSYGFTTQENHDQPKEFV